MCILFRHSSAGPFAARFAAWLDKSAGAQVRHPHEACGGGEELQLVGDERQLGWKC